MRLGRHLPQASILSGLETGAAYLGIIKTHAVQQRLNRRCFILYLDRSASLRCQLDGPGSKRQHNPLPALATLLTESFDCNDNNSISEGRCYIVLDVSRCLPQEDTYFANQDNSGNSNASAAVSHNLWPGGRFKGRKERLDSTVQRQGH